ncbi:MULTISPECIES: hypothetical protein [unclassified Streptomyces]|uniref:hypothetical protein n=1 Tax=unclassified Streptomyces TaxID=2593676 RepID=UPI00381EC52E
MLIAAAITGSATVLAAVIPTTVAGGSTLDLRDVTAGPDGGFAAEVTVPEDSINSDQQQSLEVRGLDSGKLADTPFHVTGWGPSSHCRPPRNA